MDKVAAYTGKHFRCISVPRHFEIEWTLHNIYVLSSYFVTS